MTLTDLDLAGLRDDIQGSTLLPSFADVERRAARRRRRGRIGRTVGITGMLAVLVPALLSGGLLVARSTGREGLVTINVGGNRGDRVGLPAPDGTVGGMTHDLVAVDGTSGGAIYGLVDVCRTQECNLQLVTIGQPAQPGRVLMGSLLRSDPRDRLTGVRLTMVNDRQASVTGYIIGHAEQYHATLDLPPLDPAQATATKASTKRPVQVKPHDPISVVTGSLGTANPLLRQPPLRQPQLTSLNGGWWVTGTDPDTGHIGISVSRDQGASWKTAVLDAINPNVDVALATSDGVYVYAVYGMAGAVMMTRSRDGGRSWTSPAALPIAVLGASAGVYLAGNRTVLAWTDQGSGTTIIRSDDRGATWDPTTGGPTDGPIARVPGGTFFSLGADPEESFDGLHWFAAQAPYTPVIA
ncbi:MAG TPA: sialidase family protein [Micromonosporaceae bacterium]|nr:sialidase family protein [Micromonosporaceae bacterium]